jgi:uncharacterized BrkB/YihY/UPF0761 family membrane protein
MFKKAEIYRNSKKAQSALEYALVLSFILAAVFASNFVQKIRNSCENMYQKSVEAMK